MSWSVTAKGAPSAVLESLETQLKAVYKNLEETAQKEAPIVKSHIQAMFHFLTQKLSNAGSAADVEVTAVGHKAEDAIHEMDLKIRQAQSQSSAAGTSDPPKENAPANS